MSPESGGIRLRRAGPKDVAAITACSRAAYARYETRLGYAPIPATADYARVLASNQVWLLDDGSGCLGVLVLTPAADHLLVYSVAIDPAHQGLGLGRRLIVHAEAEAKHQGLPEVRLYTNARMSENIAFYTGLGYRETGRRPHPSRQASWLVDMVKPATPGAVEEEAC
jgi:ribosomal protein S18 acetylase RimI-like enzyme